MILENIMLREINQIQKDKYCIVSLMGGQVVKFMETESRTVVARG